MTDKVQLAAVKNDGYAFEHIKNPTEEVLMLAIQIDIGAYFYHSSVKPLDL